MGGETAAPAVRKIYEGIYGFAPAGKSISAALPGGRPATELPVIKRDGTVSR
jgi:penicillin-binding protein 2